ncbi:MAG: carbohydrate-binding protein, partial [Bifidobacteriaceae bacterium]|nr:carbohydrate-binding protein [Bifidobacteriaceae bacterium]
MRRTLPRLTALIAAAAVTVAAVTAIPANGAITPAFYEPNPNNWLYFGWENDHPKSVSTMGGTVYPGRGDAVRYTLSVNETEYTPDERSASRRQNTTWYQADGYMNSPVSEWNAGDTGVRIKIQHVANRVLNDLATVVFTQVTVTNSRNVPAEVALNVGAGVTVEVPLGGRQPDVQTNTYTVYELDVPANGEVSLDFAARANGEATSIQLTGLGDFASNYAAVKAYYDELISGIAHPVSLPDEEIRNSYLNAAIVTQQTQVATQHVNRDWVAPQWNGITAGEVGYSNAAPVPLTVSANRYAEVSASRTAGETGGAPTIKTDVIESVRNDTWVYMPGVDFGEPKNKVVLRASIPAAAAGGTGDIYFGSMDGSPVATFALLDKTPGTWDEMGTFVRDISPLSGVHDVYIKFRGQSGPAFFNLRAMTFLGQGESVPVGAREVTQVGNGVRASAYGDSVENITDGDWLRYGSLQVTGNVTGIGVVAACPGTEPCGSVEFMVGSLDSSPVATLPINPTAGWADYQVTGTQLGTPLPPGIYDLYVRAQAPTGVADDVPLFNLSALQFYLDGSDPNPGHYGSASGVDLTGANAITLSVDAETHNAVYELQVRTGSYDGPLIASLTIDDSNKGLDLAAALSGVSGVQSLWFSWTVEDEGQYYTDYEARTSGGNKATIGSNYDRLHTHDHPNKVDQIIREGNIELGKRILGSPYYLALPVELYSNFLDAPPKFIVPFATMWQVLDNAGRAEFFTPAVKSRVKAAAKKVSDYMTGPLGLMEKSNTLDNGNDYLLVDNFAVLLGYTAYAYLAENWGWSDEAAWATERMETVNTALNSQLDAWEDQVGAPWYMACLEQTCSFWGRHVQRNPAYDGNWLASSLMTATFPWDAVMKGFDLGGTWSDNFDASIERMAELRDESPIIPEGSWGAWWGHYYGSAYNVGQNIPLLYSEKHREMVIRSYEWLMKAQT